MLSPWCDDLRRPYAEAEMLQNHILSLLLFVYRKKWLCVSFFHYICIYWRCEGTHSFWRENEEVNASFALTHVNFVNNFNSLLLIRLHWNTVQTLEFNAPKSKHWRQKWDKWHTLGVKSVTNSWLMYIIKLIISKSFFLYIGIYLSQDFVWIFRIQIAPLGTKVCS